MFVSDIPETAIQSYFDIFTQTMERLHASERYFFSYDFFSSFIRKNPDCAAIAMVFHEGRPVSAELLLLSRKTMYSFLGGTMSDAFAMRPNDFLKINVMDWGREQLFENYFLGGGKEDGDTLYHYKKSFSPHEQDFPFFTGRKIINKEAYDHILKLMPVVAYDISEFEKKKASYFPLYRSLENVHKS